MPMWIEWQWQIIGAILDEQVQRVQQGKYLDYFIGCNDDNNIPTIACDIRRCNQLKDDVSVLYIVIYCTRFYCTEHIILGMLMKYNYAAWIIIMRQLLKLPCIKHNYYIDGICESRLDRNYF